MGMDAWPAKDAHHHDQHSSQFISFFFKKRNTPKEKEKKTQPKVALVAATNSQPLTC